MKHMNAVTLVSEDNSQPGVIVIKNQVTHNVSLVKLAHSCKRHHSIMYCT